MQGKKPFLALSAAFAALFVGCEWTGSSESDSWSSAYDAMNFSGTYRAVTTAAKLDTNTEEDTSKNNTTSSEKKYYTTSETATFVNGSKTASGRTLHANIVPGSFQATAGGFVWNDNANGGLVFGGGSAGGSSGGDSNEVEGDPINLGTTSVSKKNYNGKLPGNLVPGTVSIRIGGSVAFQDLGTGALDGSGVNGSGTVNYGNGTVQFSFKSIPPTGEIVAHYKYTKVEGEVVHTTGQNGSGAILYPSGSWSLTLEPAITANATIVIHYSYYEENSKADTPLKPITTNTNTGTDVSALTVSQNGQNLTITLNNGIVMSGKFTNVQQTGKVNQDTNAGYNTYNAQFQVQSDGNRFVGSLNYDLSNGYRMLNGTWTWGKSSYDVQAVGPAWLNSADASTLSPGVVTK